MDLQDLSFLTKFMTQFKKIKRVDIGESKLKQKELGELTKAVQQNPYIQGVKLNDRSMSKKAKALMKAELEKNREIQRYGTTAAGTDNSQTELDLASQHVDIKAVSKMVKFKAQL